MKIGLCSRPSATCGLLRRFCALRDFRCLLSRRSGPQPRHLPDSRVPCENEFAGAQRRLLEILRICRKDLPTRHLLPQHLDGSHAGEFTPQALVVLLGGGEPHAVVSRMVAFVAKDKNDLVLNIDRKAAEHGAGPGRQRSYRVEYEFMRNWRALLDGIEGVVRRAGGHVATRLRHDIWEVRT